LDGFWELSGSLGGKAWRSGASGFGDSYLCFSGGGHVAASKESEALVASLEKLVFYTLSLLDSSSAHLSKV
jgi:hypothetical protein